MKDILHTFKEKLYECDIHVEKIEDAKEYLKNIMPLTVDKYISSNKIDSSFIDQLNLILTEDSFLKSTFQ
ncbi:MAG: hypothetical protein U9P37_06970 [Pseudomonadota bacterium]|nr:hypothetical protein [Pseudomonadota bacterium]